ncbi:MAG: hypothetical protein ACI8PZ_000066 [Myxococcota bacterium]|jgi:hypothetical protein
MPYEAGTISSEILAVHAALIPGGSAGRVLLFGGDEHNSAAEEEASSDGWKKTRVYDIATGALLTQAIPSPGSDVFCAGHAFLADGRLLIGGGTSEWGEDEDDHPADFDYHAHGLAFGGHRRCWIYNPSDNAWIEAAPLNPEPGRSVGGGRWYPTLVTLGTGEVMAFFGHPRFDDNRHRNTTAEKYSATLDHWSELPRMANPSLYPDGDIRKLMYPRCFTMPDGRLFFATGMPVTAETTYSSTFYDPQTGDYVGDPIAEPANYGSGWSYPAALLPLLPSDDPAHAYRPRVLFLGQATPRKIDLGAANPTWQSAGTRTGSMVDRRRTNGMAVLLPTGQVCAINGVHSNNPEDGTLRAELYSPGIDWATGAYTGVESWETDESGNPAQHVRNYHSTALLLPDGRVWVAGGNTNAKSGDPDSCINVDTNDRQADCASHDGVTWKKLGMKRIEIYRPPYVDLAGRPTLSNAPAVVGYGQSFTATCSGTVERVAMIRFGSVTHGSNYDQRYVGLRFDQAGNTLSIQAPPSGNIAPPGFYMLWVVDTQGRPCQLAATVRVAHVRCDLILDRNVFSIHEVDGLLNEGGAPALVKDVAYLTLDGLRPTEVTGSPTATLTFQDTGATVPTNQMRLVYTETLLEDPAATVDAVQRATLVFDLRFGNDDAFDGFDEQRTVVATVTHAGQTCTGPMLLTQQPSPFMRDVDPDEQNKHWLSIDLRVFQIREGQSRAGVTHATAPHTFLSTYLDTLETAAEGASHPFRAISTDQQSSKLELARFVDGQRVYNYAIARVRYRAQAVDADDVQCFFRAFTTAASNLRYDPDDEYRRDGAWPNSTPLLGTVGGELVSVPFFGSPRVNTTAGGVSMTTQTDPVNRRTIDAGAGERTAYFGAWLDINQPTERFPWLPLSSDGPFEGTTPLTRPRSIQELIRGEHQCLVAEIRFQPGAADPISQGLGPSQSDRLAQRNLAIVDSDNPGSPASRTVAHTFEIAPTRPAKGLVLADGPAAGREVLTHAVATHAVASRGFGPDQILIRWGNFPSESEVQLMFGDLDVDVILAMQAQRATVPTLRKVDANTLAVTVGQTTWIPVPVSEGPNFAALLTVTLPPGVKKGEHYTATVYQVSGQTHMIRGAWELSVPIRKAAELRAAEVRKLSVMKHIHSTIALTNRWHPVFTRYLGLIADRVQAYGTDPGVVHGNPDGTGEVWTPTGQRPDPVDPGGRPGKEPPSRDGAHEGRVVEVVYDACGCFRGFILRTCEGDRIAVSTQEPGIERLARQACADGTRLAVDIVGGRIRKVTAVCC